MSIVNRNLSRRIENLLYSLQRDYGGSFDFYQRGPAGNVDVKTGVVTVDKSVTHIRRGIILPAKIAREAAQNISVISANKSFIFGGTYDTSVRMFIVSRRDIPDLDLQDFEPTPDDWIVYNSRKYEIKSFQDFEFDAAWVFTGKSVLGDKPEQIYDLCADDLIRMDDSVSKV
jgi:hypothetical protein